MRGWGWDLAIAGGGALLALAALGLLHGELLPLHAGVAGLVGAGLRRVAGLGWAGLPAFLSLPLDLGVASVGALVAVVGTLGLYRPAYALLRLPEALALGAAAAGGAILVVVAAWSHQRLAAEIAARDERVAALRERELQARLGALQARVHPHFLFNTLNTLAEVVHEDADQAEEMVQDLAGMMRYALQSSAGAVALGEELDVVRRYLRLEGARLGPRLRSAVQSDEEVLAARIPGMLVQPLVENAVRHAVAARPEGGSVRVAARAGEGCVIVEVEDDGPGLPAEVVARLRGGSPAEGAGTGGAGGGLGSVRDRLALTWPGGGAALEVDEGGPGARLRLRVPR